MIGPFMTYRALLTGLAFGAFLAASPAVAQNRDNDVVIRQDGTDNSAVIDQSGLGNLAGSDDVPMFQTGIFNAIDIDQVGDGNTIGLTAPGLEQLGRQNTRDIHNEAVIEQRSNNNVVGSVVQRSLGSVVNGANRLTIRQTTGDGNAVNSVRQIQEDGEQSQTATIEQTGRGNLIDRVEQRSNDLGNDGENVITVKITGSRNGQLALSGFALRPQVADSSFLQEADTMDPSVYGNKIDFLVTGNDNRFGMRQGGRMNRMIGITVNGNDNQLGLRQDGTENDIQMDVIGGDGNEVGIDQIVTNTAVVDLIDDAGETSDDNRVHVFQQGRNTLEVTIEGDLNAVEFRQDYASGMGGENEALADILGHNNFADVTQEGSNLFDLTIAGDDNTSTGLSGAASLGGQRAGVFAQRGIGNDMGIEVRGNANATAATQTGDRNFAVAMVMGNVNQAAILQDGDDNIARLRQNGTGNIAGIYQ